LYYVKDTEATQEFYEKLGFHFDKGKDKVITYLNWFSIEFRKLENLSDNKCGEFVNIKVDNVDEMYERLKSSGIKPEGEPKDVGGGIKELFVRDPDGYNLIFFQKR